MMEELLSVGIDLGTTTTQMIVSKLGVENTAAPFTIPQLSISSRTVLYRSPVHFTPLRSADTLDAEAIGQLIRQEYARAGIRPEQVKTGAVIITGETARKENARQVLEALAELAGDFVVATAGPALESVLAARGAGADRYARAHCKTVLHMDIGGGTSNLALFGPDGALLDTGCLNVGGRLMKFDRKGRVTYVSPVLAALPVPAVGELATEERLRPLLDTLVRALEEAAGLQPVTDCLARFITDKTVTLPSDNLVLSFSGGVADLIENHPEDWLRFGDLGVLLGRAIRNSRLCAGAYVLGRETLRATVIGAGSYSTELSGSTVSHFQAVFPLQNLPVAALSEEDASGPAEQVSAAIRRKMVLHDLPVALSLRGIPSPGYGEIQRLADGICGAVGTRNEPVVVVLAQDMGKALGQALRCRLGRDRPIVCLDGLSVPEGSYLDVAAPVGGGAAIPVVVKTLAFM